MGTTKKISAVFIGWQEDVDGCPPFPLFNIVAPNDSRHGTTVDMTSLKEWGVRVPDYPPYRLNP